MRCEHCRGRRDGPPHVRPTGRPQEAGPPLTCGNNPQNTALRQRGWSGWIPAGLRGPAVPPQVAGLAAASHPPATGNTTWAFPVFATAAGGLSAPAGAGARGQHRHRDGGPASRADGRPPAHPRSHPACGLVAAAWLTAVLGGTHPATPGGSSPVRGHDGAVRAAATLLSPTVSAIVNGIVGPPVLAARRHTGRLPMSSHHRRTSQP